MSTPQREDTLDDAGGGPALSVFDDLRQAFRQAVENFKEELNRDQVTDTVDGLLRNMGREIVDARAYLGRLEDDARDAVARAEAEEKEAGTCRRREELADRIGDGETARIAREYAEKHERHARILRKKATALSEEIRIRKAEVGEMERRFEKARRQRESLRSKVGTDRARRTLSDDDLFSELDRIGEEIDDAERYAGAVGEVGEALDDAAASEDRGRSQEELDRRLEELKRRMDRGETQGP